MTCVRLLVSLLLVTLVVAKPSGHVLRPEQVVLAQIQAKVHASAPAPTPFGTVAVGAESTPQNLVPGNPSVGYWTLTGLSHGAKKLVISVNNAVGTTVKVGIVFGKSAFGRTRDAQLSSASPLVVPACYMQTFPGSSDTAFVYVSSSEAQTGITLSTTLEDSLCSYQPVKSGATVYIPANDWLFLSFNYSTRVGVTYTLRPADGEVGDTIGYVSTSRDVAPIRGHAFVHVTSRQAATGVLYAGIQGSSSSSSRPVKLDTEPIICSVPQGLTGCTEVDWPAYIQQGADVMDSYVKDLKANGNNDLCGTHLTAAAACLASFPKCDSDNFIMPVCSSWCNTYKNCPLTDLGGSASGITITDSDSCQAALQFQDASYLRVNTEAGQSCFRYEHEHSSAPATRASLGLLGAALFAVLAALF